MTIEQKLITVTEFETFLSQHPNGLYELIHGEIVEKVTTQEHAQLVAIIIGELYIYFKQHPELKAHFGPEGRYRPKGEKHNDRLPDVAVHLTDAPIVKKGAVLEMPDFAVEVKSPDDGYAELRDKAHFYLQHGCKLVWLVYPPKRIVEVVQPDNQIDLLVVGDILDGGTVLPGFSLPVVSLFS